jgi:class 3 adenylate cyclase
VRASVLFCDIRGFTALSERQAPEEIIDLLNMYYALMFEAITAQGGIVTLMIGDGLMAVFGAPQPLDNPAQAAVTAAQDMFEMIGGFNAEQVAAGAAELRIGVGIATGEVIAGYAGTEQRATYTCIGNTVNLAARLEAHTKQAGCDLLIDGATHAELRATAEARRIVAVTFKGFSDAQDIFSLPV